MWTIGTDAHRLFEIAEPSLFHQGLLNAEDHARFDRRFLICHQPWGIPSETHAVPQSRKHSFPGKAKLLLLAKPGERHITGRGARLHGGNSRINDSNGSLES